MKSTHYNGMQINIGDRFVMNKREDATVYAIESIVDAFTVTMREVHDSIEYAPQTMDVSYLIPTK